MSSEAKAAEFSRLARMMDASAVLEERMEGWSIEVGAEQAVGPRSAGLLAAGLAAAPGGMAIGGITGLVVFGGGCVLALAGLLLQEFRPARLVGDGRRLSLRVGSERRWSHAFSDVRDIEAQVGSLLVGFADGSEQEVTLTSANARLLAHWLQIECWGTEGGEVPPELHALREGTP